MSFVYTICEKEVKKDHIWRQRLALRCKDLVILSAKLKDSLKNLLTVLYWPVMQR